jgi:Outer membrane protein transport protein (OMPP1/FadL/TodX)
MKKIFGLLLAGSALLISNQIHAQTFAETALMFSRTRPGGSARIQSMGGAQVSLGGDYSSALSNPAGLGMYNRGEIAFTPSLNFANANANYLDNSDQASKTKFGLPGFSIAFHKEKNRGSFQGGTFSIVYTHINDFNRSVSYQGTNPDNSVIDYFIEQANGFPSSQFDEDGDMYNTITELAYKNYLIGPSTIIDPDNDPTQYFTDVQGVPFQKEDIRTSRGQNQWSFSYGANFSDKFFLGAGIGFTSLRYKSKKVYSESFTGEPLDNLSLTENLEITGSGFNFTAGGILRATDDLQIGLSATTPTFYELNDTFNASISTRWNNFEYLPGTVLNNLSVAADPVVSNYNLNTPSRVSAGLTYFIGKYGFVSADVERVNYKKAKYSAVDMGDSYDEDNETIKSLYKATMNYRVGGEFRLKSYRFRTGYNLMSDPYASQQNGVSGKIQGVSAGVGYRSTSFYIDMAVTYFTGKNSYRPYNVNTDTSPLVLYDQSNTNVLFTLGFPF